MLDIKSFSKALKTTWVKIFLDQNKHGKWKIFFEVELQNLGGTSFFYCNLHRKDLQGYVQSEDAFLLEVVQIWAEINFENKIGSYNHFLSTNLWHNSLIRVEGRPIFFKEWSSKGIHKVSHLMKDSNSFLSYAEFKECHNVKVNFLSFYGLLFALKALKATFKDNLRDTTTFYEDPINRFLKCP